MPFILTGFVHETNVRVFRFEQVEKGRERAEYTVRADLNLIRKYRIQMQDLPLLCRQVLEQVPDDQPRRAFTYTEAEMGKYAEAVRAANLKTKKYPPRRHSKKTESDD